MGSKKVENKSMDALSEMKASVESGDTVQKSDAGGRSGRRALQEMKSAETPSRHSHHNGVSSGRTLKIFQEIDSIIAQFFQSLKVIDSQFGEYAQIFYNEANRLADMDRSEEENRELIANIALGLTTTAIGKLWQSILVSKQLGEIKKILKNEAREKLKSIRNLKKSMPSILEVAEERFREESYKDAYIPLLNLRSTLYHSSMLEFLMATYEAALNDKFQNTVGFPTYAWVNRYLLYACLGNNASLVNNENIAGRQKAIDWLVSEADSAIQRKHVPPKSAYLFAKDPGIMAIAICDYYPMEEDVQWVEDEKFVMESESAFAKFMGMYYSAAERPDTPIAEAVLNNETLVEMNEHFFKIAKTREEYDGNVNAKTWTFLLICLLGYLVSFVIWNFEWYWSIAIGLSAGFIARQFMSFAKLEEKTIVKLSNISKTIQMSSYEKAGFQQIVNLAELEQKNRNVWVAGLCGGLIGLLGGPIGCIIGVAVGIIIASIKPSDDKGDYSYDHIRVKTTKKVKLLLFILVLANLYIIYQWLLG